MPFSGTSRYLGGRTAFTSGRRNGNAAATNFKLQGEYFRRSESGTLTYDTQAQARGTRSGRYASAQSGWYLQGVYQFMPRWRVGLRYDRLDSGTPDVGLVNNGTLDRSRLRDASRRPSVAQHLDARLVAIASSAACACSSRATARASATSTTRSCCNTSMSLGAHGAHRF